MVEPGESVISKRHNYGEDCLGCRLLSGFGIIGMSIYVLTAAKQQKTAYSRNFIYAVSFGIFGLGTARLLQFPPFQRTTSE